MDQLNNKFFNCSIFTVIVLVLICLLIPMFLFN